MSRRKGLLEQSKRVPGRRIASYVERLEYFDEPKRDLQRGA